MRPNGWSRTRLPWTSAYVSSSLFWPYEQTSFELQSPTIISTTIRAVKIIIFRQLCGIISSRGSQPMDLYVDTFTWWQIIKDLSPWGFYAFFGALARLAHHKLLQPSNCRIVDSFCDVEPTIETTVVATSENQHKLSCLMLCFGDSELRIFFFEIVRVDESGLVS